MKPTLVYPLTDKQAAFDYVWHHFITEGNPRGIDAVTGKCVYDTPSGGCAVGCLLPPDLRKRVGDAALGIGSLHTLVVEEYENKGTPFLVDLRAAIPEDMQRFFGALQFAHDNGMNPREFETNLRVIARRHDLVVPQ